MGNRTVDALFIAGQPSTEMNQTVERTITAPFISIQPKNNRVVNNWNGGPSKVEIKVTGKKNSPMKAYGNSVQPVKRADRWTKTQRRPFINKLKHSFLGKSAETLPLQHQTNIEITTGFQKAGQLRNIKNRLQKSIDMEVKKDPENLVKNTSNEPGTNDESYILV